MTLLPTQNLSPGVTSEITIPVGTYALKVSNTSPYDLDWSGFGVIGDDWIPSGVEWMLYASAYFSGAATLTLVNNKGITPANNGIVLLVAYPNKDSVPEGHWPVTIPTSVVQTSGGVITAQNLDNEGNVAGTQIIKSVVSGDGVNQAVSLTNDAQFTLGDALHQALMDIIGNLLLSKRMTVTPQPVQTIATNGTIQFTGSLIHVQTNGAAATGVIMQVGVSDGDFCFLLNDDLNHSITFAAAGSNVGSGSNNQLFQGRNMLMLWNANISMWENHGGN